ncbi:MAG: GNAT family N-acetyltransferase [Oscillospiraceae bacterium]
MSGIAITLVRTSEEISLAAALAAEIWTEHYTPLIGSEQVAYMVEKFQSIAAITAALKEGYLYYTASWEGQPAGYIGIRQEEDGVFLSKYYVKDSFRGKGVGSALMAFVEEFCTEKGLHKVWLTCNKGNSDSLAVYGHLGFVKASSQTVDIGGGYVMDDYVMEKTI